MEKTIEQLVKENNAMLKVLLWTQATTMVVLDEAIDKLNEEIIGSPLFKGIMETREKMVECQFKKMNAQVGVIMNGGDL